MPFRLIDLIPDVQPASVRERTRSALGALFGVLATGLVCHLAVGSDPSFPALMAPVGASAVLLFAVPASPLAQPWSIIGGNLVAALVGVTAAAQIPDPFWAAAVAVGAAIALMMTFRCVHPPSGAVALTAVLGGPAIHALGYGFVLWPVAANSVLLLASAILFNNLSGRAYPHLPKRQPADVNARGTAPLARAGFAAADLDVALKEYGHLLDVDRADLEAVLRRAELRAFRPTSGPAICSEIMTRDVIGIAPDAPLKEALELMRGHHVKMLPVTDEKARVLGVVTQTDLLDKTVWGQGGPRLSVAHRMRLSLERARAANGAVSDVMTTAVTSVRPDTPIAEIVLLMTEAGLHHLPVVDADGKLAGIVSQTDLVAALLADAVAAQQAGGSRSAALSA